MKTVGLTGGIATGKSSVSRRLVDHGVPVVDADVVARQVVEPGTPGLSAIVDAFGADVLDADGALDRSAMRQRIINDPAARKQLEGITHPRIFEAMTLQLRSHAESGAELAVVDAALMVETGSYRMYDALVVVSCSEDTQLERLMARDGMTEAHARGLIATQLPLADKEALADFVIRNDGTLEDLDREVDRVLDELRA